MLKTTKRTKVAMPAEVQRFFRESGKRGGETRANNLTAAERTRIARKAIAARWAKKKGR